MAGELAIWDGKAERDERGREIAELRAENQRLARALEDANMRANRAREDADRALSALRRQLSPLYRALQAVFGELDAAGIADDARATESTRTPTEVD